jgi:hypothetical protein
MGKLNVKNGTPVGNEHLCARCASGQFMVGYRESDQLVVCTSPYPSIVVPFTVLECSSFTDKHRPSYQQMERLAIDIEPVRVSARTAGFSSDEGRDLTRIRVADEDEN